MRAGNTTVARGSILDRPADVLAAALPVFVCGLVLVVYATGELAGLISHARIPKVAIGQIGTIIAALPHHLADPKQAWPAAARPQLPGPLGFVLAALAVTTLAITGTVLAGRRLAAERRVRGYASRRQLGKTLSEHAALRRATTVRPSLKGLKYTVQDVAVCLGKTLDVGMTLWTSIENSVLLLAAPRQGKTSQVIIPWLRHWRGPALVTSIRIDVLLATAVLRAKRGKVLVFAPTRGVPWPDKARWSPVSGCEDFAVAFERADTMVQIGKPGKASDSRGAGFFGITATTMLAAWMHAAALNGGSMRDVVRWALDDRITEAITILAEHPYAEPGISSALDGIYRTESETRSNMFTTVRTAITPLLSERARDTFCPAPGEELDIEQFLRGNGTIYVIVPKKQARALAPLVSAFFDVVTETAKQIGETMPGGRLDPPLGILGDEIANIAPLENLPDLMSYAGGSGIFLVAVFQDFAQARDRWGEHAADMLWGSATVKMALGGLSGDELEEFSKLAGMYRETVTTHQHGTHGSSAQTSLNDRRTIYPDEVRTLSEDEHEALIIHATTPAVKVRMTRHYEGPDRDDYSAALAEAERITALERDRVMEPTISFEEIQA